MPYEPLTYEEFEVLVQHCDADYQAIHTLAFRADRIDKLKLVVCLLCSCLDDQEVGRAEQDAGDGW